jgi:sialate O-acetylesterase
MKRTHLIPILLLAAASAVQAEVKLHALFTDGAVLQRELPLPIWGTASDGEKVTVSLAGQTATATAKDGKWEVKLKPLKAGGPHVLTVEGTNKLEVKDVLVGEVWLCSGQSNMAFTLNRADNAATVIPASENPKIRIFKVPGNAQDEPQHDLKGKWELCNPQTVPGFTAVGYFFGRDLQKALDVPIGLIGSSVGGTPAQAWTSKEVLESLPAGKVHLDAQAEAMKGKEKAEAKVKADLEAWKAKVAEAKAAKTAAPLPPRAPAFLGSKRPTCLYNGMIAPLVPYAMRGAIWYQGEANSGDPANYRDLLPAMIGNWRKDFNPDLVFLIVQLAPYDKPHPEQWAYFRDTQRQIALHTPKTGIAAIPDAGDAGNIHPTHKEPAGQRLALQALSIAYHKELVSSGPAYKSAAFAKGKATLSFDQIGDGLVAKDGDLTGFLVAGDDQKFVPATAKIVKGGKIEVSSADVAEPKAVRYAWKNMPDGNLWNKAGLPASPFRTDDWPQPPPPAPVAKPAPVKRAPTKAAKPAPAETKPEAK